MSDSSSTSKPSTDSFITLSKTETPKTDTEKQTVIKNVTQLTAPHIPPPLQIRQSTNFDCLHEFEKFMSCIRLRLQSRCLYEYGQFCSCDDYLEQMKWCLMTRLGNYEAQTRLLQRKRETYHNIDQLPWSYKQDYLKFLKNEDRLPKRMEKFLD